MRAACALAAAGVLVVAGATGRTWVGVLGAGACLLAAWRSRPDPDVGRWLRGAAGEAATARLLGTLPSRFVVLHDRGVPGSRANIDHLVIGPTGIWVVDSKAYRAPLRARRGVVWAGEHEVATSAAAWQAEQVATLLRVNRVDAVVAVHATGLRRRGAMVEGVQVVPAHRLARWLRRGPRTLSRSDVAAVAATAARVLPRADSRRRFS